MGAVAPSHGNGIRGANRAGNPGWKKKKNDTIAGVSHWDRPRTKDHRTRHVYTEVTADILTADHLDISIQ